MSNYIKSISILGSGILCLALAACGSNASSAVNASQAILPSAGSISVDLNIDVSASTSDKPLRQQYLSAAMSAVDAVVQRGGRLSIAAFFSRGLHPVKLLDTPVPTPSEVGGVARAQQTIPIRNAADSVLAEALELARRRPEVARALTGIGGEATDVAGTLAGALAGEGGQPHAVVVLLTDGDDAAFTGHYGSSPRVLASRISPELPKVAPDVTVALTGIGGTAKGTSTKATERLLGAWRLACVHTGARCYVAPDLDLTHLFG